MKITCPNNPEHKRFYATAHVTEDWIVSSDGDFETVVEGASQEVVHKPDHDDLYTCVDCGEECKAEAT